MEVASKDVQPDLRILVKAHQQEQHALATQKHVVKPAQPLVITPVPVSVQVPVAALCHRKCFGFMWSGNKEVNINCVFENVWKDGDDRMLAPSNIAVCCTYKCYGAMLACSIIPVQRNAIFIESGAANEIKGAAHRDIIKSRLSRISKVLFKYYGFTIRLWFCISANIPVRCTCPPTVDDVAYQYLGAPACCARGCTLMF